MILYHGSDGPIDGVIVPDYIIPSDGFYMYTRREDCVMHVANRDWPCCVTLGFDLSEVPEERIVRLSVMDKVMYGLLSKQIASELYKDKSVIIGPYIPVHLMRKLMDGIKDGSLTYDMIQGMMEQLDLGEEYIVKDKDLCSKIEVIQTTELTSDGIDEAGKYVML